MVSSPEVVQKERLPENLSSCYVRIRAKSIELCRHLEKEDFVVQSMPDASPTKWHLAHITWFFEQFILKPRAPAYRQFNEQFHFLFNSYYYSAGSMHARPERGLLTRPTVAQILAYRRHVDDAILETLVACDGDEELHELVTLGLNHEQQHQELLLTDIKHVFFCNPLQPVVDPELPVSDCKNTNTYSFRNGVSGVREIGADGRSFCFDNELPRHPTLLHAHSIGSRLVTNAEYLEFIRDGGYRSTDLWLSDGWATVSQQQWNRPLYWSEDLCSEFTLGGVRDLDLDAPVTHVSYYEADAFARWAGARLPTEAEWEVAASDETVDGNFLESGFWHPTPGNGRHQFFGDVWEWTSSPYGPYPGFTPASGSLGEYNGKFMCNQMTVRGGSCVSAGEHIRASYRSFFYPDARWQFLGIRLAKDSKV